MIRMLFVVVVVVMVVRKGEDGKWGVRWDE